MPTSTRIVLTVKQEAAGAMPETQVFDTLSSRRYKCTVDAACAAFRGLPRPGVASELRDAMLRQLLAHSGETEASTSSADVELHEHALLLKDVISSGAVQQGAAAFRVCDKWLMTNLRCVRAVSQVADTTLELLALVHSTSKPQMGRPTLHFVGSSSGELVNISSLQFGKKASVAKSAENSSHYMRRSEHMHLHASAMRNVFCEIDKLSTKREHSRLVDAYVSQAMHSKPVQCVSLFV